MSLLRVPGCKYDAFISYAGKDNDLYPDYVLDFWNQLKQKLESIDETAHLNGRAEIFFDHNGFPPTGGVDGVLQEAVDQSAFLIIFLSRRYLDSQWCFKELDRFRHKFGGRREDAFNRIFLLVTDSAVLDRRWPDILEVPNRPKYIKLFEQGTEDLEDHPLGYPIDGKPSGKLNQHLIRIAKHMERESRSLTESVQKSLPPEQTLATDVLLGHVSDDLLAPREALKADLAARGIRAVEIDQESLFRGTLSDSTRIGPSTVFVQLYSHAPVLYPFVPGGHLAIQQDILKRASCTPKTIWCFPESAEGVVTAATDGEQVQDQHLGYVQALEQSREETRYRSIAEVVDCLASTPIEDIAETPVYVESYGRDKELCRQLVNALKSVWQAKYGASSMPDFQPVPFQLLTKDTDCVGVILVYGMKDALSLNHQIKTIEQTWRLAGTSPMGRCWLAALPPQRLEGASFRDLESFDFDPEQMSCDPVAPELARVVESLHAQMGRQSAAH